MRSLNVKDRHRFLYSQKREPQLPTPPTLYDIIWPSPPEVQGGGVFYGIQSRCRGSWMPLESRSDSMMYGTQVLLSGASAVDDMAY